MERSKRHHYLPKFYLVGFTDPRNPENIWVYEKGNSIFYTTGLTNVAVIKEYHTFPIPGGGKDSDSVEVLLSQVEGQAAPILDKIKDQQKLEGQEKADFAFFLAFMVTRVPRFRRFYEKLGGIVIEERLKHLAENKEEFEESVRRFEAKTGEKVEGSLEDFRKSLVEGGYDITLRPEMSLLGVTRLPTRIYPFLSNMRWNYFKATPDYKFLTSDNPLSWFHIKNPTRHPYAIGLTREDTVVTIPLSRDLALIGSWSKVEWQYKKARNEDVREINKRTVISAAKYVYASQKSGVLNKLVQKHTDPSKMEDLFSKLAREISDTLCKNRRDR